MDDTDLDKFDNLIEILSSDGVNGLEFFTLKNYPNYGRGLSSLLSRQPGEELFKIPLKYIFTDYNIENNVILKPIWTKYPDLLNEFHLDPSSETGIYPFLLLFYYELLYPSSSFNRIWFSLFPRNLNGHTIAWSDIELRGCSNLCPIRRDTIEIQVWIKKTYRFLQPIITEFKNIFGDKGIEQFNDSMVEFLCMTCRNRGCQLPINSASVSVSDNKNDNMLYHCFIPLGDFGNHKFGAKSSIQLEYQNKRRHLNDENVNYFVKSHPNLMKKKYFEFDSTSSSIVVRAQESILSGGQICYEYTAAPNWELLCNFGFAVKFNPYDRVIVNVSFDDDDPIRLAKELQLLNKIGVSSYIKKIAHKNQINKYKYSLAIALTLNDACPQILLAANRIKSLNDQQLNKFTTQEIVFMDKIILKNIKNKNQNKNKLKIMELNILRNLQASLNVLFSGYKNDKPAINSNLIKHNDVNIVYQSIRMILRKSIQIIDGKVQDLAQSNDPNS